MPYYVYMLLCEGGSYYTGYAKDLESRFRLHLKGEGAKYTRMRKPVGIIYTEQFQKLGEALRRERQVKNMSREEKLMLVKSFSART